MTNRFEGLEEKLVCTFKGYPILKKKPGFLEKRKLGEFKEVHKAMDHMNGTETVEQIAQKLGIDRNLLLRFVARLIEDGFMLYGDEHMKKVHDKYGNSGLEAYCLINGKRTVDEISKASKLEKDKVLDIANILQDLIEVKDEIISFKQS